MISRTNTSIMDKITWWLLIDFLVIISINYGVASECQHTYMDLVFIVDASGSVGTEHFQEQLQFLKTFISKMPIDEGNVRIGIVVFGTKARVEFTLSRFNTTTEIRDAITAITYDHSNTNVAAALRLTRKRVFTQEGDRDNVTNVAILIADGSPNVNTYYTAQEAQQLRNSGVRLITLTITSNPEVFHTFASMLTSDNIISIDNFSQLDSVLSILYSLLCNECQQTYMDLAFIVDASGSIGAEHFQEQLRFLQTFISKLPIDEGNVRIGIVVFGTEARVEVTLSQFNSRKEILDAISAINYDDTGADVTAALRLTKRRVFTQEGGDRDNITNVAILVAGGSPNEETANITREAKKLKNSEVRLIALAITSNPEVFDTMASRPISDNIISIDSFSQLDSVRSILYSLLCNESKTKSKKSTKKPATPPTSRPQSKSIRTTISERPNSETETTASTTPRNTMKSTKKPATPPTSPPQSKSIRTTISERPNSETETTASTTPRNTMKSTKKPATPPTSPPQSKSIRTTISERSNSETETTASTTPRNTMKSTKKPATPLTSSSRVKSIRTTISTRPTSGTETTASKTPTNTLATTSTPIAPISTTTVKISSTATHMTSTQNKTTPGFITTTSTTLVDTHPATTVNTRGSSSTFAGLLNVSGIITSTINAALQRCYERCENPVWATSTTFSAIKSLRIEKKGLSKHRREKTTASDDRQSAAVVASVVLAIAWTPILCLVIWDLIDLCCNRRATTHHIIYSLY
ncbi:uncharacterized protein LOC124283588 isoform X2 [Haliotis rubra]|uniref:uncharacterized protein LOC124283588 isoform X2 n=1 Tax=Haliotis rubra TaxID=36100 RepID=UPI001EE5C112|nr:uncharacterized protein LOC124283588 isoform X2 [Haliotis rubra]